MVQWLRLCASAVVGTGLIPGRGSSTGLRGAAKKKVLIMNQGKVSHCPFIVKHNAFGKT